MRREVYRGFRGASCRRAADKQEVVDRQALVMASNPERFPAPPEGLREREIAVLVPVVFRLER